MTIDRIEDRLIRWSKLADGPLRPRIIADIEEAIGTIAELRVEMTRRSHLIDELDQSHQELLAAYDEGLTERDRLRAWKAEAIEVLARWDEVAELIPMQLGDVKSQAVKDWVQKVQAAAIDEAIARREDDQ